MSKITDKSKENKKAINAKEASDDNKISIIIDLIFKCIPVAISIIALVMTFINIQYTKNSYFYNRIFQPLTYHYDFDIDNENFQKFDQYKMPLIKCKVITNSGHINNIMIITTDENNIDTVFDYNSKFTTSELLNKKVVDFDLRFSSIFEYDNCVYQYIFIYIEGTNNEWNLDCIQVKYNENHSIESITMLDTTDLIRINMSNTEFDGIVLDDYEMVFNEIKNIKK